MKLIDHKRNTCTLNSLMFMPQATTISSLPSYHNSTAFWDITPAVQNPGNCLFSAVLLLFSVFIYLYRLYSLAIFAWRSVIIDV